MNDPAEAVISLIKDQLAVCERETAEWERAYAAAEQEMRKVLAPYRHHHGRIQELRQCLKVLEKK